MDCLRQEVPLLPTRKVHSLHRAPTPRETIPAAQKNIYKYAPFPHLHPIAAECKWSLLINIFNWKKTSEIRHQEKKKKDENEACLFSLRTKSILVAS